jgi:hypothetical protein
MKALTLHIVFILICLSSCGDRNGPPRLEGAWLGEGIYSTTAGSKDVKAQLEILSDGTYRFLILEPSVLMLTGMEKGNWTRDGSLLTLSPVNGKSEEKGDGKSVFETLRKSSPENLRVKNLTLADDLSFLNLSDGPMELEFYPNAEATRKLEEAGEVTVN